VLKVRVRVVNMLHGLIGTVLSNVLAGELVVVASGSGQRHGVVHVIDVLFGPLAEVTHESVEVVTLGHVNCTVLVVLFDFVHEHESHVLVVNIENEVGAALVDLLSHLGLKQLVEYLIGAPGVVLVDQIPGVPSPEKIFAEGLGLTVSHKGFVHELINVDIHSGLESFLGHPGAAVASKVDVISISTDFAQLAHKLAGGEVGLARISQDADGLLVGT
jgi:hypothetical protein